MLPTFQDLSTWVQLESTSEIPQAVMARDETLVLSRNETDVTTSSTLPMETSIMLVTVLVREKKFSHPDMKNWNGFTLGCCCLTSLNWHVCKNLD